MLNKLELKKLPFVDTCPEPDQKRIQWVRNGECVEGASTKYGNDGNLNAAGVGIFTDVLTLEENSVSTKEVLNKVIDNVNNINEALEVGADVDVIKQIAQNKENIEILQVHMQFAENNIGELETTTEFLKEDVGVYDPSKDDTYRPLRDETFFIKTEIGAYPGQDINGNLVVGAPASGIKKRVIDNTSSIVDTINRVQKLEDDYQDSDVGSLSIKINEIRDELGPRSESIGKPPVYSRISTIEVNQGTITTDIANIKTAIAFSGPSIDGRVTNTEQRVSTVEGILNTPITGLSPRMSQVEKDIGVSSEPLSINGRLSTLRTDHNALSIIVGQDSSSGLRGQVASLNQTMGPAINPGPTTVLGRLRIVETKAASSESKIQDIQAEIGNNNSGIKGSTLKHTVQIDGTNANGVTLAERGLWRAVTKLEQNPGIGEAPTDGQEYVRKNASWAVSTASSDASDIVQLKQDVSGLNSRTTAVELKSSANANDIVDIDSRLDSVELDTAKISTLETDVSTLKSDTSDLSSIRTRLDTVEADVSNLKTATADLSVIRSDIAQLKIDVAGKIEDAPSDGQAYVRVDNEWVLLSTFLTP